MANIHYLWSVIDPSSFDKDQIQSFLKTTEHSLREMVHLREQMAQAGIPTFQLVSSIRELEKVKYLLLLAGIKKLRRQMSDQEKQQLELVRENYKVLEIG